MSVVKCKTSRREISSFSLESVLYYKIRQQTTGKALATPRGGNRVEQIWKEMFQAARAVQNGRKISDYIDAGGVAAAILSSSGKI